MAAANGSDVGEILMASAERAPWGWALLASVILALVKGWPVLKKIGNDRESGQLAARAEDIKDMRGRINQLEDRLDKSDRRHDAHIEILTQLHNAEIAVMRHRLGNEAAVNMKLLTAIAAGSPEKLSQIVEVIEADRTRREESIAAEQAELIKLRASAIEEIKKLRAED